jgi:hypothetical protein
MIVILNVGGDKYGVCHYRVQINDEVIAEFDHDRSDQLEKCLLRAAQAVGKKRKEDEANLIGLLLKGELTEL